MFPRIKVMNNKSESFFNDEIYCVAKENFSGTMSRIKTKSIRHESFFWVTGTDLTI